MLKRLWNVKVTRFAAVGVFNTLFDISMLNTLVFFGHVPYIAANLVSASISMTVSYFLNHRIVFRSQEKHSLVRFTHFFAVTGIGILAIQSLVIYIVTHLLSHERNTVVSIINDLHASHLSVRAFDLNVAKIAAVLIAMTWNFLIYHFVIFKTPNETPDADVLL